MRNLALFNGCTIHATLPFFMVGAQKTVKEYNNNNNCAITLVGHYNKQACTKILMLQSSIGIHCIC